MELSYKDKVTQGTTHSVSPVMQRKESFFGIGTVEIREFKMVNGEKVFDDMFQKHNLIVEAGRGTLIDLLIGDSNKKLAFIRWGKGGAAAFPDGDPLTPFNVEDTDTDVMTQLLDKALNVPTRISTTEVEYIETIICDEVNNDVNEAAMMFEDPITKARSIFARITFPTVRLTIDKGTGIEIRWRFNFNKAVEAPVSPGV